MADPAPETAGTGIAVAKKKISTVLFAILALLALAIVTSLVAITIQLAGVRKEASELRDILLPQLIKLSQLSQEASASIAIAPALSTNPSRFEFETLLARIQDKRSSQTDLLQELAVLISDESAMRSLQRNSELLVENQTNLVTVVRQQINVRKRLEKHVETFQKMARDIVKMASQDAVQQRLRQQNRTVILTLINVLLDPTRARFSRNRREILARIGEFEANLAATSAFVQPSSEPANGVDLADDDPVSKFSTYWSAQGGRMMEDKAAALANEFRISALVEENSLIANRLLNTANSEFWRTNEQLTRQIARVADATLYNLVATIAVVLAFAAGAFFLWYTLQNRVLKRLDGIREGLRRFTDGRQRIQLDNAPDEIGEISRALGAYMARIDEQETALADKNRDLERLSSKLSKYLSPQVYDSIFSGTQQVSVASSRKKLTVFFSDIVGFTELADQLESEELTRILNEYLTEMSHIALHHGATIDKYVGDAIVIFFGDPETHGVRQDAIRCVEMAIAMRERLEELNAAWQASGVIQALRCRIGIHTGFCTVGNFGSEERMDYTIIGGTVNTASRLETNAKPGQILISHETYANVRDLVDCEEYGRIEVKGIAHPLTTYSVLGRHGTAKKKRDDFAAQQTGMALALDREAMTKSEQTKAVETLKSAIRYLKK